MKKAWDFLSGKKTVIGLAILVIHGAPIEPWVSPDVMAVIYYFGIALSTGGVVHRFSKDRKVK